MAKGRKRKPIIYEGKEAELYKKMKNKWIRLAIIGSGLPFVIAILVTIFNNTFNWLAFFGSGEIILSLFSVTLPLAFDLFEIKKKDDEDLSWAYWVCIIVICFQLVLYCLIKMSPEGKTISAVVVSIFMLISSWCCCTFAIKAMFKHSINCKGGDNNVD